MNLRNRPATTQYRLHTALGGRLIDARLQERVDAWKTSLVVLDDSSGSGDGCVSPKPSSKAIGSDPIDNPKVDHLCAISVLFGDLIQWDAKNFRSDRSMNIRPRLKSRYQRFILREMREHSKFDLGIISGQQDVSRVGNKCLTNSPSNFSSDWNVLQIRVTGAETSGRSGHLVKRGMNSTRRRLNSILQGK